MKYYYTNDLNGYDIDMDEDPELFPNDENIIEEN